MLAFRGLRRRGPDRRPVQFGRWTAIAGAGRPVSFDTGLSVLGSPPRFTEPIPHTSSRPRVRLQVNLPETIHRHEGVYLGGGHRCVPEQFLHHPHIGAPLEEVGGVAVPQ